MVFTPQHIPPVLRQFDSWVVWQLREVPDRAKPAKVPVRVTPEGAIVECDANDPHNWLPYDAAVELVRRRQGELSGIGLCPKFASADMGDGTGDAKLVLGDFDNGGQQLPADLHDFITSNNLPVEWSP